MISNINFSIKNKKVKILDQSLEKINKYNELIKNLLNYE